MTNEQLVTMIQGGENTAGNMLQLWEQNCKFIKMISKEYRGRAELEDLEQEGYIGLCKAVEAYDATSSASFLTYASYWIRQTMTRYIANNGSMVRIPESAKRAAKAYTNMIDQYQDATGRRPTAEQINIAWGEPRRKTAEAALCAAMVGRCSLDTPVGEDGENTIGDLVADSFDLEQSVTDRMQQRELEAVLWPIVESLSEQQAEAIRLRYREGRSFVDAGKCMGISREAVRQHEYNALRELRRPSRVRLLRPFLYDEVRNRGMQGTGIGKFNVTWTSATEREALNLTRC